MQIESFEIGKLHCLLTVVGIILGLFGYSLIFPQTQDPPLIIENWVETVTDCNCPTELHLSDKDFNKFIEIVVELEFYGGFCERLSSQSILNPIEEIEGGIISQLFCFTPTEAT